MLRKYLARLLAFVLVLNLVLCAPLSAGAEEATFDADPVAVDTVEQTVTVTEKEIAKTEAGKLAGTQTVSVEIPTDTALSQTPAEGSVPKTAEKPVETEASTDGTSGDNTQGGTTSDPVGGNTTEGDIETEPVVKYDAPVVGAPEETVHVEDSFDMKVTATPNKQSSYTDITYDISLDQKTTTTDADGKSTTTTVSNVDRKWNEGDATPELTVNMTVVNMGGTGPTRVEHTYRETDDGSEKTEYYYNEANGKDESDTSKKYFTFVDKVVSLVTNFLGKFTITNKAFENDKTKEMSSTLASAVESAGAGETVNMLRDTSSIVGSTIEKSDDVTVDLKGHTFRNTSQKYSAVTVSKSNQKLTIKNGTIQSKGNGIYSAQNQSGNTIILDGVTLKTNTAGKSAIAILDYGNNNTYEIKNSTIDNTGGNFAITHNGTYGGANISIIGSYINADGSTKYGIYVSGNAGSDKNKLTISEDSVIGGALSAVEVKHTDVTIDDSTLTSFAEAGSYEPYGGGASAVGAALAVTGNRADESRGTIVINSGYFKGAKDFDTIFHSVKEATGDQNATITISGGCFAYPDGLYKYTDAKHAVISYNDGSEYPYEVVKDGTTPTRPGYTLQGYKDDKGNDITLAEAIATKAIAYAQWKLIPAADTTEEAPAKTPTTEAPKDAPAIIVEADSKGNNVDVSIKNSTAVVTVSTPAGEAAAVSEVTIPSVAELQKQGVDTVEIQVEENVTLELGIADTGDTLTDSIKVTREEDTLVISSGEKSEIVIHMTELKAAATEPVRIQYNKGVLTISLSANAVYTVDLKDALAADKALTVKLEDGVLKLYDKDGNLIQEIQL